MQWIVRCVEEVKKDNWVIPALKQIQEICSLFPEVRGCFHYLKFNLSIVTMNLSLSFFVIKPLHSNIVIHMNYPRSNYDSVIIAFSLICNHPQQMCNLCVLSSLILFFYFSKLLRVYTNNSNFSIIV